MKIGLLKVVLFMLFTTIVRANEIDFVAKILHTRTLAAGTNYSYSVAPALSLDESAKPRAVENVNSRILTELTQITGAWDQSSGLGNAAQMVRETAQNFDPALATEYGNIVFEGKAPSALQTRTLFVISKANLKMKRPAQVLFESVTSYKRSAKPSDFVYEYENAFNLTAGNISQRVGSDTSWLKPEAADAFSPGKDYAIKKCRQILGWRCTTALYHTAEYGKDSSYKTQFLFSFTYNLAQTADHTLFSSSQSKNQIDGTTSVLIVKESSQWLLVFGTDHRYKVDKQSFSSIVQKEFREDTERLKQRLAVDLGIPISDIR